MVVTSSPPKVPIFRLLSVLSLFLFKSVGFVLVFNFLPHTYFFLSDHLKDNWAPLSA